MEEFQQWMDSRQCSKRDHNFNLCCNHFSFPYGREVFLHCIKMMIRYSFNYSKTTHFYDEISFWIREEMKTAPIGLQNGWFTSKLELYNLQHSVDTESMVVLGLSIAICFIVLLLTTWNVLLSVFSITAIAGTVLVTIGLLVLLEWQLNAVESLFISAAVGLSIDFTVNYCISYHLCPYSDRVSRVAFSLKQMSCATVMGTCALFSAGVIMLPTTVLAYRKLGIFMMMLKCISCGFASFFFQSLCCFFGPEKNCGQILLPCARALKDYSDGSGASSRTFTSEDSNLPEAELYDLHRCLYSTGSSFSVQNVSSETSLSDFEPSPKPVESTSSCPGHLDVADSCCPTQRGHLNGKRDTLRLDLRETVFDTSTSQQNSNVRKAGLGGLVCEEPVVLPNSKPDMPDVWIKRSGVQHSGY